MFYKLRHNGWVTLRGGKSKLRFNFPKSCALTRWRVDLWRDRARAARQAYEKWFDERVLIDYRVTPGSGAWLNAVEEVQRAYPGTSWWLRSCSASEGGWGRWVPNSQGSGASGWLQFMSSTFWRMFGAAKADVQARGFIVPNSAASWYSPLGQALAGAWGYTNGRRHEWVGSGC